MNSMTKLTFPGGSRAICIVCDMFSRLELSYSEQILHIIS